METTLGKKPYKFVPLTEKVIRDKIQPHDNSKNLGETFSGKLDITIKVITPVHISQGSMYSVNNGNIVKSFMRRNDKIVIPGSSVKGMIRSIVETISNSCSPKLPNNFNELAAALPGKAQSTCSGENEELCPTCSIFGTTAKKINYKSKVKISEFNLSGDKEATEFLALPNLQSPFKPYPENNNLKIFSNHIAAVKKSDKRKFGNERLYYADLLKDEVEYNTLSKGKYYELINNKENRSIKFRGRKFYLHNFKDLEKGNGKGLTTYEMVRKDSIFKGSINYENLTSTELAILCLALGVGQEFYHKIGYGKPAYFGSIKITVDEIKDYNSRFLKGSNINLNSIKTMVKEYRDNASVDVKKAIEELEKILSCKVTGNPWPQIDGNKVY